MTHYGPTQRLLEKGASTLNDAELLAVLMEEETKTAEVLLEEHAGLSGFFSALSSEISPPKAARLHAVKELTTRLCAGDAAEQEIIGGSKQAYSLFRYLALEEQEVVAAGFLDMRNRLLSRKIIFIGNLESSIARPREILREALKVNAAKIILAHNHPSGSLEPSQEDVLFTARVQWAADAVGVPLLDHLIVGKAEFFSFAEAKLLRKKGLSGYQRLRRH